MKGGLLQSVLLSMLLLSASIAFGGDVIDSVIVTVNGVPLLQSDLDDSARFEALLQQRHPEPLTASEREQALQRLIDQELLRQQIRTEFSLPASEVESRIAQVRSQFKGAESKEGWNRVLSAYGLSEGVVKDQIVQQLTLMRFVDLRLRPTVRIDNDAIESYYRDSLVPKLKQINAPIDPLPVVSSKIEEVLVQQRMDQLLTSWLANLRNEAQIHIAGVEAVQSNPAEASKAKAAKVKSR